MKNVCIVGGAGFIGHHLAKALPAATVFDRPGDAHDLGQLRRAFRGHDTVIHLASNADIAAAAADPTVDFTEGTVLTQNVCEAARLEGVDTILYASGSGVYGESDRPSCEDDPFNPTSPYGASKAAGEALVSAYCHMFGMRGIAFRFANVVGPGQTHGVGYDFLAKLRTNPDLLQILGDGKQSKSYLAVTDAIAAMFLMDLWVAGPFEAFNVATRDTLTVDEIATLAAETLGVTPEREYSGGPRGWAGDVPVVRLDSTKIRKLGWGNRMTSKEAMRWALEAMAPPREPAGFVWGAGYGPGDDLA